MDLQLVLVFSLTCGRWGGQHIELRRKVFNKRSKDLYKEKKDKQQRDNFLLMAGQRICLYVIPEVVELISSLLPLAWGLSTHLISQQIGFGTIPSKQVIGLKCPAYHLLESDSLDAESKGVQILGLTGHLCFFLQGNSGW